MNFKAVVSLDGEIWKDVRGFEGTYMISNLGRVKSIARTVLRKNTVRNYQDQAFSAMELGECLLSIQAKSSYPYVSLRKDGKRIPYTIHRLIAEAFIPNPGCRPQVNHINGDKFDNRLENLEWVTASENTRHAYMSGLLNRDGRRRLERVEVVRIKQLIAATDLTNNELSLIYQTFPQKIARIRSGQLFREI